jgi:hypothetical protein
MYTPDKHTNKHDQSMNDFFLEMSPRNLLNEMFFWIANPEQKHLFTFFSQ